MMLSLSGGLMMHWAWFPDLFTPLIFVALVPFLAIADDEHQSVIGVFGTAFFGFFVFHLASGWWMYSSTIAGSMMAHLFNASYMAGVLALWRILKTEHCLKRWPLQLFIILWLMFEVLHQHWELAWPWFTLGHVFGARPSWVQWYRFSGSLGGSFWILTVNVLIFRLLKSSKNPFSSKTTMRAMLIILMLVIPVLLSFWLRKNHLDSVKTLKVMVVQPNIHPQQEKFAGMAASAQLEKALKIVYRHELDSLKLIVFPETMLVDAIDENNPQHSALLQPLLGLAAEHPLAIVTGAYSARYKNWYLSDGQAVMRDSVPYVLYNSALWIHGDEIAFYHKEKLVPLVEKQPFERWMKPLRKWIEQSGGFFGRYGTFNSEKYFLFDNAVMVRPLICFESAFPIDGKRWSSRSLIVLLTNDGWWKTSGGYQQHLMLARLRAIETGKWIARSANTGVSALLDPKGEIVAQCPYGEEGVLIYDVPVNEDVTFYSAFGKYFDALPFSIGMSLLLCFACKKFLLFWTKSRKKIIR